MPDLLARDERENVQVSLIAYGSPNSWLQLLPRYKIDREGDRILTNTEVVLKVAERPNEFIHCSEKPPPLGCHHEVNCSLETTAWRLSLFHSKDPTEVNNILASQLVYLHDPETRSNVTVNADGVAIKPVISLDKFDSSNLWVIEAKKLTKGGPVRWRKDHIRFRNLNSGKYLCMSDTPTPPSPARGSHAELEEPSEESGHSWSAGGTHAMILSESPTSPGTLFNLHELYSSSNHLTDGKAMQMSHGGLWIARGDYHNDMYSCFGSPERGKGMNLLIHIYAESVAFAHEEPEEMSSDPLDVFVGVAARNFLKKTLDQTRTPSSTESELSMEAIWPGVSTLDLDFFMSMTSRMIYFVNGYPISVVNTSTHAKPGDALRIHRQRMICDQGALGIVVQLIEKLTPISADTGTVGFNAKSTKIKSDKEKTALIMGNKILDACLNFVYNAIQSNPYNQMYVADMMSVLLSHVGAQPLAAKCVTEMLSSNMELQELKIGGREISVFTEKLRESRMNSMYLHLLKACCSCNGSGVIGNQFNVADHFFRDYTDVVISVHSDCSKRSSVIWEADPKKAGLYIPAQASAMLGGSLVSHGLPELSLSWATKYVDFSPLGLFGKLAISVEELFADHAKPIYENQGKTILDDSKQAVAKYFSAEMSLTAEMCLERNYSAMISAQELFSYDILVTLIKMNVDENLTSGAVQLLLRLYVDRNPQVVSCMPCLTRKFNASGSLDVLLPSVEEARVYQFALLQQLISENVKAMKGTHWKEVSLSFMQLLNKLVMFSFYGTEEKLKDVIGPVIRALDRRNVSISSSPATSSGPATSKGNKVRLVNSKKIQTDVTVEAILNAENDDDNNDTIIQEPCWQAKTLDFLESLFVLFLVVLLVVVAIGVTLAQTITGKEGSFYEIFDLVVMLIFCTELVLRYYCYVYVNKSYTSFFFNLLNCVDVVVVLIDLALLGVPSSSASGAEYSKGLRAIRLVRLVRIFRAARLVDKLTHKVDIKHVWKLPARYKKVSSCELETMVEAMNVLSSVQLVIEDRSVSLLLKGFHKWQQGQDSRHPEDIFEEAIYKSKELSLGLDTFNDIFLDNLMFENSELVQVALDLLMAHHTLRDSLTSNIQKVQLIVSPKSIDQHDSVHEMLLNLERNTEANEMWGHLLTEEDRRVDAETKAILINLIDICKERRTVLEFDHDNQPVTSVQDLLRNLGFCELSVKMRRLLASGNNQADSVIAKNNLELFGICNRLMYWFLYDNNTNQNLVFFEIQFFFDTLDIDVGSHLVIQALFSNNEELMRQCPKKLILEFTDKVCNCGQFPQYLTLHVSITNTRGKNIIENQYEIVKQLISPARVQRLLSFFCPVTHDDYKRKVELMEPFLNKKHVTVEELPLELGYHLEFLRVLSVSC